MMKDCTNNVLKHKRNFLSLNFLQHQKILIVICIEKLKPDVCVVCEIPPLKKFEHCQDKNDKNDKTSKPFLIALFP